MSNNIASQFDIKATIVEITDEKTRQIIDEKYTLPVSGIPFEDLSDEVTSEFAETFPSSAITTMDGYEIAASGGTISTDDTLLQAIGKLEKNIDTLREIIESNELVTAKAIIDIDERIDLSHNYTARYMTIVSLVDNNTIGWKATSGSLTKTISISTDKGKTWTTKTSDTTGVALATLNEGEQVLVKGSNTAYADGTNYNFFTSTGEFNVVGNTMSLLYWDNFSGRTSISGNYAFQNLFKECSDFVSAENLVLPATTLSVSGYTGMFSGCTSLTMAPALPATTLQTGCYSNMFHGCTSLTTAPSLSATTLANNCYYYMFNGCTSLTTAPALPATTLANGCYQGMFNRCTDLATAPELPVTTLADYCYDSMFNGCTSLTTAPELPATTLTQYCYSYMFQGCTLLETAPVLPSTTLAEGCYQFMFRDCTSLTTAPELPSTTLANNCYGYMFYGCSSLEYIKCFATDISASGCTYNWVTNVASIGVFVKDPTMTSWTTGNDGVPTGWLAFNDGITLNTSAVTYVDDGGKRTVTFAASDPWSATTENGWITVSPATGTFGEATITITATETASGRTGAVTITDGSDTKTISVIQTPYREQYLTLDITSGGTVMWRSKNGVTRTISYSLDDGDNWTDITSTNTGVSVPVATGDKMLLKGTNTAYGTSKDNSSGFASGTTNGTATFNIYGNVMSLIGGDNFSGLTTLPATWTFHNLFATARAQSAKHMILPATTLTAHCYRALFSKCHELTEAPALPALEMQERCYSYMFDQTALAKGPDLPAPVLAKECYQGLFERCTEIHYIKCLATNKSASNCTTSWVLGDGASGTHPFPTTGMFVKDPNMNDWSVDTNGVPSGWTIVDDSLYPPVINFDGFTEITIECETVDADIYYKLNDAAQYTQYSAPITISADTVVTAYSTKDGDTSPTVSKTCVYISDEPLVYSNRNLDDWVYGGNAITVPYSINALNGHSNNYTKDTYNFTTSFGLKSPQPTYLWFQHADQTADIYIDDVKVETHWGGYNAFFSDITNYVHSGTNNLKVAVCNVTRNTIAPYKGDFNFNATLGYAKLFTSPVLPSMQYGYDGFHITSSVSATSAEITVETTIPLGANVVCTIDDGTYHYTSTKPSTGSKISFTTVISGSTFHLWDGTINPHLYDVTLDIYYGGELYHTYTRPYGFRYYEYLINDTTKVGTVSSPYTGFVLNGHPYLLRGVCMHNDLDGKANALTRDDIAHDFEVLQELGCNFIRLAHYPHPKEVYDWCDRLGIVVQTEVPWVNESASGMPTEYYTHLGGQYDDMVNQHYNHPSILFWGLANEITPSTTAFTKAKLEEYKARIKALDSERLVGFVMSHSYNNPGAFGNPDMDWFGCNIYVGWYVDKTSNDPTGQLNTRVNNFITSKNKPVAFSEYGCGGTQRCHSDDCWSTTTKGTNQPRHDIEYEMWLHEGHIAAIRNFPQLMFTAQWQMFDIAVSSRQEGYKICLDGIHVSDDNNLKFLNNKGLVERDHRTKKDVFYLYKAEWSDETFVHICSKEYTKNANRAIKCYTNDGDTLTMYINGVSAATASVTNHIAVFPEKMIMKDDVILVSGSTKSDTVTFTSVATAPLAWSASAYTINYGEVYNGPTLSNPLNLSVTYGSSDTSVATINSNGNVTLVNSGTTTISAVFAGDVTYPATTVTYTLTVIGNLDPTYTAPTSADPTYSGGPQNLLNAGSTSDGTIQYSSDGTNWSTTIPQGTNAGNYTPQWRLIGNSGYKDVPATTINVTISKANPTYTAPTAATGLVYTGSAQNLLNAGSTSDGTIQYSSDGSTWGTSIPQQTDANTGGYTAYWKLVGDSNHNDVTSTSITGIAIAKASRTLSWSTSAATVDVGSTVTVSAAPSAGSGDGTISYSSSNTSIASISGNTITGVAVGSCTITATITEGTNYLSATTSYSVTVAMPDYSQKYLTIVSRSNDNTIGWQASNASLLKTISVSTDAGQTWTDKTSSTEGTVLATLNNGDKLLVKGSNTAYGSYNYYNYFTSTQNFDVKGNIMSLLYGDNFIGETSLSGNNYAFKYFFNNTKLVNAKNFILPATTLALTCYNAMFYGCTALTSAPALPATTLVHECYRAMFYGCTNLITAPELPATTLVESCYNGMFRDCTSLTTAPTLPATTLATYCYGYMFNGCTGLTTAPALPATTLANYCYYEMFKGCTGLTTAPALPATTLADCCYGSMFQGCTGLTTAPAFPATTLADRCYSAMFYGCTNLITAPELPATTLVNRCYYNMFNGCTRLTTAPELHAKILTQSCYGSMFSGCTSLNYIKCLAIGISASYCTENWVKGVAVTGTFVKDPSMSSWTTGNNGIPSGWTVEDYDIYSNEYLTIVSKANNNTIGWKGTRKSLLKTISVSTDNGQTWTNKTSSTAGTALATLNNGDKLLIKGNNTSYGMISNDYNYFTSTQNFDIEGNIMSLLYGDNFIGQTSLSGKDYAFSYLFYNTKLVNAQNLILPATTLAKSCCGKMFYGCTALTTAPALPATELANYCYNYMFNGCTGLTTAPELPATTLTQGCYSNMFSGCTGLATAPELPATTLTEDCYYEMFYNCTSLTTAPELPATTLTDYCYRGMFNGCISLTTAPVLPATALADYCYQYMFSGCTSLTTAPELPATTLANNCYQFMFNRCTSLNYIKCLATDISAGDCTAYWVNGVAATGTFVKDPNMSGWTTGTSGIPNGWNVKGAYDTIPLTFVAQEDTTFQLSQNNVSYSLNGGNTWVTLPSSTSTPTVSSGSTIMWKGTLNPRSSIGLGIFSSTGKFEAKGNVMSLLYGDNFVGQTSLSGKNEAFLGLFKANTKLTNAQNLVLPATTLANSCYNQMFGGCSSLTAAPELPATILTQQCYYYMFSNCTSLTSAPALPATTLAESCYYMMFRECTSLTSAPALPATTLADDCYSYMFYGCTSLNYIKCLATNIRASYCTNNWVNGVAASGTFVKDPNMSSWTTGTSGIPSGWNVQDAS